jgi:hypothetical protein
VFNCCFEAVSGVGPCHPPPVPLFLLYLCPISYVLLSYLLLHLIYPLILQEEARMGRDPLARGTGCAKSIQPCAEWVRLSAQASIPVVVVSKKKLENSQKVLMTPKRILKPSALMKHQDVSS